MSIYHQNGTNTLSTQTEIPVYGSGRLGIYDMSQYRYEFTDHLGNMRALASHEGDVVSTINWADYYPFGLLNYDLCAFNFAYRYGYQGKFSEKDDETGWNSFDLRMYDPVIGRWMSGDPARQYPSPYLGMGNNPVSGVDPDGGFVNPIYDKNTGEFLGTDSKGLQGEAIMMNRGDFSQGMSHQDALSKGTLFSNFSGSQNIMNSVQTHFSTLPSRPDYDGIVTDMEARRWWQNGNGQPLFVNTELIDVKAISTPY